MSSLSARLGCLGAKQGAVRLLHLEEICQLDCQLCPSVVWGWIVVHYSEHLKGVVRPIGISSI